MPRKPAASASPAATPTSRAFGVYVHVPFCQVRCGYCDFNTYAPGETDGATREGYVQAALAEITMAREALAGDQRPVSTVFFGGGTPTMLDAEALAAMLRAIDDAWSLTPGAEVTTEANPDSVTPESLATLASAGFTRISLGMQSAVPHVLRTLERTHDPLNVERAVTWAREAGLAVSVDLIYGTPGESLDDWRTSVEAALALEPDHISAYALVIEPGTKMGAQLRRGEVEPTDPDTQADMYELADRLLSEAGLHWYEVSNWARSREQRCRHNLGYWRGDDWWGIGPGAHSYLGSRPDAPAMRWWNAKHPRAYAARLASGQSPEAEREELSRADLAVEDVMLRVRLADGMAVTSLTPVAQAAVPGLAREGLLDPDQAACGTVVLTLRGRLLADAVVHALTD